MYKVSKERLESTKQHVDFIYELCKDGYEGSFSTFGVPMQKVKAELVKRGVLDKTKTAPRTFTYKWVASMAPTNQFYKSVAIAIGTKQSLYDASYKCKKKSVEQDETPVVKALSDYTIEELWAEMRSRGAEIENGHLVIIKKTVLA